MRRQMMLDLGVERRDLVSAPVSYKARAEDEDPRRSAAVLAEDERRRKRIADEAQKNQEQKNLMLWHSRSSCLATWIH